MRTATSVLRPYTMCSMITSASSSAVPTDHSSRCPQPLFQVTSRASAAVARKARRDVIVRVEQQRAADADEDGSSRASGGNEQIEQRGLGGIRRPQRISFGMTEEAGEEELGEEESDADLNGQADVGLRQHVAERRQKDHEQTHDDPAPIQPRRVERDNECQQINGQRAESTAEEWRQCSGSGGW